MLHHVTRFPRLLIELSAVNAAFESPISTDSFMASSLGDRLSAIPFASSHACPAKALRSWLAFARIESGPLFRFVKKGGILGTQALSAQTVATLVKEYAEKAGLDAPAHSGHSLRAGLITSAAKAGASSWKIREQTGHRSEAMQPRRRHI